MFWSLQYFSFYIASYLLRLKLTPLDIVCPYITSPLNQSITYSSLFSLNITLQFDSLYFDISKLPFLPSNSDSIAPRCLNLNSKPSIFPIIILIPFLYKTKPNPYLTRSNCISYLFINCNTVSISFKTVASSVLSLYPVCTLFYMNPIYAQHIII